MDVFEMLTEQHKINNILEIASDRYPFSTRDNRTVNVAVAATIGTVISVGSVVATLAWIASGKKK